MKPSIGRIVHYCWSAEDAQQINRRRTTGHKIAERMKEQPHAWPAGAQAHIGNEAVEGEWFPAMIVKCWGESETSAVQLQVFLDGNDTFWATSIEPGDGPRFYRWPARV